MTETKIIIFLNTDSILYLQITWPSMGCLFFSAQSQTFHSTDSITANFSNSFPVHDHMDYFFHLCYIKACQLFASSPLFLLPRNKSQILEKRIKHVTLYNTSIWITHCLLTSIQNFLLLLLQITEIRTVAPACPLYTIHWIQCDCTAWSRSHPPPQEGGKKCTKRPSLTVTRIINIYVPFCK